MTANLRTLTKEKRESPMKRFLMPATALAVVLVLVLFTPTIALSETHGAQLRITGTIGTGSPFNVAINDESISSSTPGNPAGFNTCTPTGGADDVSTMAYVLQGGSATGCDPGDNYEVTDNNPTTPHQFPGSSDALTGFHIETHYRIRPAVTISAASQSGPTTTYTYTLTAGADLQTGESIVITGMTESGNNGTFTISSVVAGTSFTVSNANGVTNSTEAGTGTVPVCNSNGNVCIGGSNPLIDTGFLTVKNTSGSSFTGSITLTGTSPIAFDATLSPSCPPLGLASDSFSGTLAPTATWTFALAPDSSNCGGYTPPQTLTLAAPPNTGTLTSYTYGVGNSNVDKYVITPINNLGGEKLTITPVLVTSTNASTPFPYTLFNAGGSFPSTTNCAPYADFTTKVGKEVCVEFQSTCAQGTATSNDCSGSSAFFYQLDIHHDLPSGFTPVGGISLLKAESFGCPTRNFNKNIVTAYSSSSDPVYTGGGGGHSCFVGAYNTAATAAVTDYHTFVGFQSPVSNTMINILKAGSSAALKWQQSEIDANTGGVVPNLDMTLCTTSPCSGNTVAIQAYKVACPSSTGPVDQLNSFPGTSSLQNFGNGLYQFNLQTKKTATGCFKVALIYGSGAVELPPALFQFK